MNWLWISCVKTLTAFAYLRGAGGAEFQRYEIWACKRQPCMLYSGDTCVLMDTAPANHGHLKWLSMQVAILSSLSLNIFQYLDLLESPLISFFGSSYLIWNDALGGTVVFMLLFCFLFPSCVGWLYITHNLKLFTFDQIAHFRPRQPPSLLVFLLCVHKLNPQVTRSVCDPSLLSPM